ncbi:deoxyhypusine synthase [Oceanidesulfovibrio indonesiensis]|uniref:Deoxyhypusine synthase n=1 Tax=Oceanidesulfovibrio indonesiensis TaxID=54767 RepID=A0A7M3MCJ5_9BACT|nr:deoxyhypusine synthase family protein [Oceanidesulfovibrio indonesiensis]TVM15790.1 deoxyhypusine synthase [Oceanidesulfovibrio indonesiensis]
MSTVRAFMEKNYKHFNARETLDAARAWEELLDKGGQMFVTLAGAMSTAEIGISLAPLIEAGKVHGICCTAANLEEDLFNLFDNPDYRLVPHYNDLSPEEEVALRDEGMNRVTDTCIPEWAMLKAEKYLIDLWKESEAAGTGRFPWEYMYALLDNPEVQQHFRVPKEHSWVWAAKEKNLPIYTPGWEDCTLGNKFTALVMSGRLSTHNVIKTGTQQMEHLAKWYMERADKGIPVGFFQVGGGIAGDFPICVVPMIIQDLHKEDAPHWAYFCQISDSTTSYGSYSGAVPNEKITWHKLDVDTPKFMINSDASIVAPLIFSYLMGE